MRIANCLCWNGSCLCVSFRSQYRNNTWFVKRSTFPHTVLRAWEATFNKISHLPREAINSNIKCIFSSNWNSVVLFLKLWLFSSSHTGKIHQHIKIFWKKGYKKNLFWKCWGNLPDTFNCLLFFFFFKEILFLWGWNQIYCHLKKYFFLPNLEMQKVLMKHFDFKLPCIHI